MSILDALAPNTVAAPRREPNRLLLAAIGLTLALLALRLFVLGRFGLVFDEAYYWVWAKNLSFGYFDHPPMVAYFIRLGTALFGDNRFGVRFVGTVSVAIDAFIVYRIVLVLFADRSLAAWSVLLFNATLITAGALLIGPDQPVIFFWLLTFYGLARLATGGSHVWWLFVGAMAGLAAVSKYTGLFLGLSIILWLLLVPQLRRELLRPWVYLGGILAGLVFAPVFWWNATHDWASFVLQFGRIKTDRILLWAFPDYVGAYFGLLTPFVGILSVAGIIACFRGGAWRKDPRIALLIAVFTPLTLYFVIHTIHSRVEGNWMAPMLMSGIIFATLGLRVEGTGFWRKLLAFCRRWAVPTGVLVGLVAYVIGFLQVFPLDPKLDPLARLKGWESYTDSVEALRRKEGADYLLTNNYGPTSELMFYLPDVPVFQLGDYMRWRDFPARDPALANKRGLLIGAGISPSVPPGLDEAYDVVRRVADVERSLDGTIVRYPAFIVERPKPGLPLFMPNR